MAKHIPSLEYLQTNKNKLAGREWLLLQTISANWRHSISTVMRKLGRASMHWDECLR